MTARVAIPLYLLTSRELITLARRAETLEKMLIGTEPATVAAIHTIHVELKHREREGTL